eukprot:9495757-Pyramimonas_sp.AAC.1
MAPKQRELLNALAAARGAAIASHGASGLARSAAAACRLLRTAESLCRAAVTEMEACKPRQPARAATRRDG